MRRSCHILSFFILMLIFAARGKSSAQTGFRVEDGYYRLITSFQYVEGVKAMYAEKGYGYWGTLDETDCRFLWRFDYDINTEHYKVYNAATEGRFGQVYQSQDVRVDVSIDSIESELNIYFEGTTDDGHDIVTFRRVDQDGDYQFLHEEGHQNGYGSGGNLVGWNESASASGWTMYRVPDAEADSLIKAYQPIRDAEQLQETYQSLSVAIGRLELAIASGSDVATEDVLTTASSLRDKARTAYRNRSLSVQQVLDLIDEVEEVICLLEAAQDTSVELEDFDSLGPMRYFRFTDGTLKVVPEKYILGRKNEARKVTLTLAGGNTLTMLRSDVESETKEYDKELPVLLSFKFNDKYNDGLNDDVKFKLNNTTNRISVRATVIGKRLTPSFTYYAGTGVYVNGIQQKSKKSSQRFDKDKTYVVARDGESVYMARSDSSGFAFVPFGRNYNVHVSFPTDRPNTDYGVPVIYINTFDQLPITSKTEYKYASFSLDGAGIWDDIDVDSMQIRGRGNSTWGYSKKPYRLKFPEKIYPLGMKGGKSWILLANAQTGSMMSNAIAMKMADMVGTAGCNHIIPVELYLNDEYVGSYNFTEKIGFANNSIELNDETNAVMLELDVNYDESWRFHDKSYSLPVNVKHFGPDDTEQSAGITLKDIKSAFNNFTSAVARGDGTYINKVDIDKLVKAWFVTDFTLNTELNHPKSWYLYNENILADSLWVFGPVWDFDWGFGYMQSDVYYQSSMEKPLIDDYPVPFFEAVWLGSDVVKKAYYELWTKFIRNGGLTKLTDYCDDYYKFAARSFVHNATRWGDGSWYAESTENAKQWLVQRAAYLYGSMDAYDIDIEDNEEDLPEEPNQISDIAATRTYSHGIYTLQGLRIDATDLSSMPPGIYIAGGKKHIAR